MKLRGLVYSMIILFVGGKGFSQQIDINTNNGYVADGYDVVAYFSNKAVEGKDNYVYKHNGNRYKFSSEDNLNKFKEQPDLYIPQYGGYCAWAIATKGKKVDINPKSFEIRDGKLYLFYHNSFANTLKKWQQNKPNELQKKADNKWKELKDIQN